MSRPPLPLPPQPARRRALLQGGSLVLLLTTHHIARGAGIVAVRIWPAEDYSRVTIESDTALKTTHRMVGTPPRLAVDIEGLERTARQLLRNGRFEELQEDVPALLQEFAPEDGNDRPDTGSDAGTGQPAEPASPPAGAGQRRARLTERLGPRPDAAPASRSPPAATGGPWPPDPPAR